MKTSACLFLLVFVVRKRISRFFLQDKRVGWFTLSNHVANRLAGNLQREQRADQSTGSGRRRRPCARACAVGGAAQTGSRTKKNRPSGGSGTRGRHGQRRSGWSATPARYMGACPARGCSVLPVPRQECVSAPRTWEGRRRGRCVRLLSLCRALFTREEGRDVPERGGAYTEASTVQWHGSLGGGLLVPKT